MWPIERFLTVAALALAAASCSPSNPDAKIDTIEVHRSGDWAYNVIVHANGRGEFEGSSLLPERGKATFRLKPGDFQRLSSALRPYWANAEPVTDKSLNGFLTGSACKLGEPYTTDAPALYLRWQGPKTNVHNLVDFGCDAKTNSARNRMLLDAVNRLPIQQYLGDFR